MTNKTFCCDEMLRFTSENELGLLYVDKFRDFGIEYRDGGTSYQHINFCPFCGTRLPTSLRDKWFDEIEAKGLDPWGDEIPEEYKSSKWWSDIKSYGELVLSSVNYDADSNLTVMFEGLSNKSEKKLGEVIFNMPLAFFVMEEAVDAAAYSEDIFNSAYGFLKSFSQTIDPLEPVLHVSAFIPNSNLQHFRIIFRDEIVHVISLQNPVVTWAGETNSPLNKPNT